MRQRGFDSAKRVVFIFTAGVVWFCFGGIASAAQDDLLESLLEKNEAAWQKIQSLESIQYTLEREWLNRRSGQPYHGTAQFKKQGDCMWYTYRHMVPGGPLQVRASREIQIGGRTQTLQTFERSAETGETIEQEQRRVVNDRYAAEWPVGNPFAYRWDHNSVETARPSGPAVPWGDHLLPCFGESNRRFREAMKAYQETHPGQVRYKAVEVKGADGKNLYQIQRFLSDGSTADLIWLIDPEKGYLAIETTFYAGFETPMRHRTMQVEEIAPGLWYPVAYEETEYATPDQTAEAPAVKGWTKAALKDFKINEPIPDEQFEIGVLGFQEDEHFLGLQWTKLDGTRGLFVYRDGELVPMPYTRGRPPAN